MHEESLGSLAPLVDQRPVAGICPAVNCSPQTLRVTFGWVEGIPSSGRRRRSAARACGDPTRIYTCSCSMERCRRCDDWMQRRKGGEGGGGEGGGGDGGGEGGGEGGGGEGGGEEAEAMAVEGRRKVAAERAVARWWRRGRR